MCVRGAIDGNECVNKFTRVTNESSEEDASCPSVNGDSCNYSSETLMTNHEKEKEKEHRSKQLDSISLGSHKCASHLYLDTFSLSLSLWSPFLAFLSAHDHPFVLVDGYVILSLTNFNFNFILLGASVSFDSPRFT